MKLSLSSFFFLLGMFIQCLTAQETEVFFTDHPCLTPDGSTIIFSYEGDLWKVSADGGQASRITAMEGVETRPRISPDGRWLAFAGHQYGNADIYLMPLTGGEVRQMTFHEAADLPESWSWDSRQLFFRSSRLNSMTAYTLSIEGGTPQRLFSHYFNWVHNLALHPVTGAYYFNESWESSIFEHRKGYKGDFNPDIKSYNPANSEYIEHTDYEGKDFDATIDRSGHVYFLSDAYNGEYNLYQLEEDGKKRLTDFNTSARHPQVSADGSRIVFQRDYQLWIYETSNGEHRKVDIEIFRNNTLNKLQDYNVSGEISAFDLSNDAKKLALVSRGELFVSDAKGKYIRHLPTSSSGRVLEVYWLKGDTTILFNQTVNGYQNWFSIPADGTGEARQITDDRQNNRLLSFNSDQSKAAYLSGREELRLLDLESMESSLLQRDELWGFYNDRPRFSPDDRYLLFTAYRNFERDLMLYDLQEERAHNLTQTSVSETGPFWSPDGRYIYLATDRTNPSYPSGPEDLHLYRMALQDFPAPFRSDKFEDLFSEEDEEEEEKEAEKITVSIKFEDVMERLEPVGPRFGAQAAPYVLQDKEKTIILYTSNHDEGKRQLWKTVLDPFEKPETKKIEGVNGGYSLREADGKYFLLSGGDLHTLDLDGNKVKKIEIDHTFRRKLQAEFEQMFYETWANMEENFYNENFHGVDWAAMRDRYARFLPHVNNREDLRRLTNDMLGELNTSHFGFRSSGKEEEIYHGTRSLATGILFEEDDPYVVRRVVKESPASRYGIDIRPGDRLIAVDGEEVDPALNRASYFARPSLDEELNLTFRRQTEERQVKLHPTSYTAVRSLLYDEWQEERQERVDNSSDQRIAYVHMKNMGGGQLNQFLQEMVAEGYQREALILDLRYNTGGNVHDEVLQFLSQRPYLQWKYRGGSFSAQPHIAPAAKPIVLLINEPSLSDAEMTAAGFRELGLGTIVGTETYRWIIFTTGKGLVDGSFYRLPAWGCYTLDGKNLERSGVEPDVYIRNTFLDRLEGRDPQLDKAIELILQELEKAGSN